MKQNYVRWGEEKGNIKHFDINKPLGFEIKKTYKMNNMSGYNIINTNLSTNTCWVLSVSKRVARLSLETPWPPKERIIFNEGFCSFKATILLYLFTLITLK